VSKPKAVRQVGYFVPPSAMTWAAYFPPTDRSGRVLYVLGAALRAAVAPTVRAPIRAEWRAVAPPVGTPLNDFGYACRIRL
jgi:hypothetical protein